MPRRVDVYVGWRLRQRRVAMRLTQSDLAGEIGVRFQQVQKYETGANRISASTLWKIAQVLQVPVSYFFDGLEQSGRPAEGLSPDILSQRESVELVHAYHLMPEKQRQKFLGLLRVMADGLGMGAERALDHVA